MIRKTLSLTASCLLASYLSASDITADIAQLNSSDYELRQAARLDLRQTLVSAPPEKLRSLETELFGAIGPDRDFATRDWSIRMLELVGTRASVPALTALLDDPDERIVDLARRALSAIPATAADTALEKAVLAAAPRDQPAFVDALAYRGKPRARNELDDLLAAGSTEAALALGKIGSRSSRAALIDAHESATGAFKEAVELALLDAGLRSRSAEKNIAAEMVLQGTSPGIQLAAFGQLLDLDPAAAEEALATELADPSSLLRRGMLRRAMESSLRDGVVSQLPSLPASDQIVVLSAIADFGYTQFEDEVLALLAQAEDSVQPVAITTLGFVGSDASFDPLLARYLQNERDSPVADALARLQAPSFDQNLLATARGDGAAEERIAALRLLVLRNTGGVIDLINDLGRPGNPPALREAAFQGMEVIGTPSSVKLLLATVLADDEVKRQAQGSLKKLSANLAIPDFLWEQAYAPAMAAAAGDEHRRDVIVILDGNSGPAAATYLAGLMLSDHPLRPDALRCLQRWTDISAGPVWLDLLATPTVSAAETTMARAAILRLLRSRRISGSFYDKVALAKSALIQIDDGDYQDQVIACFEGEMDWQIRVQILQQFPELLENPTITADVAGLIDRATFR
jgi:hypothetical protein